MTLFEYFMVLLSVVLSLALTQLVSGIGELVRARRAVRWSVTYALWLAIGFAVIIDLWTSLWLVRDVPRWSLFSFLLLLLSTVTIYLTTLWLLPRDPGSGTIGAPLDLHAFAVEHRRLFVGALLGYIVTGATANLYLLPSGHFDVANYVFMLPMVTMLAVAWLSPNRIVQRIVPALYLILYIAYFAIYFRSIGS